MAFQQIVGDALGNDLPVGAQGIKVTLTHLGGDFETDMKKLAEVWVVAWV